MIEHLHSSEAKKAPKWQEDLLKSANHLLKILTQFAIQSWSLITCWRKRTSSGVVKLFSTAKMIKLHPCLRPTEYGFSKRMHFEWSSKLNCYVGWSSTLNESVICKLQLTLVYRWFWQISGAVAHALQFSTTGKKVRGGWLYLECVSLHPTMGQCLKITHTQEILYVCKMH